MKKTAERISKNRISRFAVVGIFNTAFDFTLFNILVFGIGKTDSKSSIIIFNTISASITACISFFLNRRFVFRAHHTPHHYLLFFVLATLSGLYLIQNSVIWLVLHSFGGLAQAITNLLHSLGLSFFSQKFVLANLAKAIGTVASMVWNYNWYKHVIFRLPTDRSGTPQ